MGDRSLFSFDEVAERWGVSPWTVRRAADRDELKTVNIGARRLIHREEILRAEQTGIGKQRKVGA